VPIFGERKVSVLDEANKSTGKTSQRKNDLQELLESSKGVRHMHAEIAFDSKLRVKANILEG